MLRGLEIVKLCRKAGEKAEFFHLETKNLKTEFFNYMKYCNEEYKD